MGLIGGIKRRITTQKSSTEFWENTITPIGILVQTEKSLTAFENKYELYDAMVDVDPELAGNLDDLSALIVTYYNGIFLDLGEDREASTDEEAVNERIKLLEEDFDFRTFIHAIVHGALRYGDMVLIKGTTTVVEGEKSRRVPAPLFMPRPYWCFRETAKVDYYNRTDFIQKANWLAVNPYTWVATSFIPNAQVKWYRNRSMKKRTGEIVPPQTIHFSLMKDGILEKDQYGILNMNCISKSPLKPLESLIKYKRHAIIMDMAWREANVPFIHYAVNLDAYDPTRFPGATQELKIAAAEKKAKAKLEEFRDAIVGKARDQGIITPSTTTIAHVEPKTRHYASPNEQLNQTNISISARMGALQRVRTKEGGSYAADLLLSSITEPRLRIIGFKFFKTIEAYIREFLAKEFNPNIVRKVKIRKNLILPHERLDRAKEAMHMSQTPGTFLRKERRDVKGYLPLSKKEEKQLYKEMEKEKTIANPFQDSDKSAGDVRGDAKRETSGEPKPPMTPHSDETTKK